MTDRLEGLTRCWCLPEHPDFRVEHSYKTLSGLVDTTGVPPAVTRTHSLSSVTYSDIPSLGALPRSPLTLCPKWICTFTHNFSPFHSFSHKGSSQHTHPKISSHLRTHALDLPPSGVTSFLRPSVCRIRCSLNLKCPPSHPRCPQGWQEKFLQTSRRAEFRPVFEWGGCGHLAAPAQGHSAHKSLY